MCIQIPVSGSVSREPNLRLLIDQKESKERKRNIKQMRKISIKDIVDVNPNISNHIEM